MSSLLARVDMVMAGLSWQELTLGLLAGGGILLVAVVAYVAYAIWQVNDQIHAEEK